MSALSLTETVANSNAMMTSREIAELTSKEHKTVLRDIRSMLIMLYGTDHLEQVVPEQYRNRHSEYIREHSAEILNALFDDGTNRFHQEKQGFNWERDTRGYISIFHLDKNHTLTLISGYDAVLRMRIIKRWQELEAKRPAELTREQILVMALESERERMRLAQVIEEQRPMVEFHEEVSKTADEMTIAETCAVLFNGSVMEKTLRQWMKVNYWLDKRKGIRKPTKWSMQRGYMRLRELPGNDGRMYPTPVVCAPGLTTLRHLYRTGELFVSAIPKEQRIQLVERMI